MKLYELIVRELRCKYVVYLSHNGCLSVYDRVFDSFYDIDNEEEVKIHKTNYRKYMDYKVVYFYADIENGVPYTKIVITEPETKEFSF